MDMAGITAYENEPYTLKNVVKYNSTIYVTAADNLLSGIKPKMTVTTY